MTIDIRVGDALTVLKTLPEGSVQCCVTSPPYWGLRDYGVVGQLGLESTPQHYVARLVMVFREVRRVLADRGVLWLNMGDAYAGSWGAQSRGNTAGEASSRLEGSSMLSARQIASHPLGLRGVGSKKRTPGMKAKDRIGLPWMLAFALRSDGWYLRDEVIWHKPNPMPSSVTDRTTPAHEQVFLLSKKARYFYDAAAIRTPAKAPTTKMPDGWDTAIGAHGTGREKGKKSLPETQAKLGNLRDKQRGHGRQHAGFNGRWDAMPPNEQHNLGANARSVWTIPTHPFPEAHFATFAPGLAERCILAGSAKGDTILDPFSGAGTTALVADRLGRNAIGIELNPEYAKMARRRITDDAPLFHDPEAA